ncbi:MAG: MgtC/SapB family protein [Opitutaceae bacterium]
MIRIEEELMWLGRLAAAMAFAGILGWEREKVGKSAGLRTHMLVAFGAALVAILAEAIADDFSGYGDRLRFDPLRVLEAVLTGVGFLGAGMIFLAKDGERVKGLTTAASIWATAGVGVATGVGEYVLAGGGTLLVFVVLHLVGRVFPE